MGPGSVPTARPVSGEHKDTLEEKPLLLQEAWVCPQAGATERHMCVHTCTRVHVYTRGNHCINVGVIELRTIKM